MGEYHFGLGRGRVSAAEAERVNQIAKKHDAYFVSVSLPGEGPRYWFSTENLGSPFDQRTARTVMEEVGSVRTRAR